MVGCYVEQYCYICFKIIHPVQLKTADFYHIVIARTCCYLIGKTLSYVACQTNIVTCIFQNMISQHGCGCFPITAGNTNHFGICKPPCKFNFGNNGNILLFQIFDNWCFIGDSWTFYYFIGIQNQRFGMLFLFPFYLILVEQLFVVFLYFGQVGNKHIKTLLFCQYGSACSTFSRSKYNDSFHFFFEQNFMKFSKKLSDF